MTSQTPQEIPVYTEGDDLIAVTGEVIHLVTATKGTDERTTDNVIKWKNGKEPKGVRLIWTDEEGVARGESESPTPET